MRMLKAVTFRFAMHDGRKTEVRFTMHLPAEEGESLPGTRERLFAIAVTLGAVTGATLHYTDGQDRDVPLATVENWLARPGVALSPRVPAIVSYRARRPGYVFVERYSFSVTAEGEESDRKLVAAHLAERFAQGEVLVDWSIDGPAFAGSTLAGWIGGASLFSKG